MRPRFVLLVSLIATLAIAPVSGPYPPTHTDDAVVTEAGRTWPDPYQWLEDDNAPAVRQWAAAQRAYALDYLRKQPQEDVFHRRITALSNVSTQRFALAIRGSRLIYERVKPDELQPSLVARDGITGAERVLFDPLRRRHGGGTNAIGSIFPAPDGRLIAFTTQIAGSEEETLHVVDATTGTLRADTIEHAGGGVSPSALAWDADGNGFVYARYPLSGPPAERHFNIALYHHVLGADPASDTYVFGRSQSRVAEYVLARSPDGRHLAAFIEPGDLGDYAVWTQDEGGAFRQVATASDHVKDGSYLGDTLLLRSSRIHPTYDVLAVAPGATIATARPFIAAGSMPIVGVTVNGQRVFGSYLDAGESVVRVFGPGGASGATVPLPPHVAVSDVAADPRGGSPVILAYESYTSPDRWVAYDAQSNTVSATGIASRAPGDYSHLIVDRHFVLSRDGTARIPLTIVHLAGVAAQGQAPTILTAYGGYGIVSSPFFVGTFLAWLERGGVLAFASVRGGGEYGAAWHLAAVHAAKTKSADDLASCATWLGIHGFGDTRHLGIIGGSDGGFLMGMAITRNPNLYRAVVGQVGIYDIPRWQLSPNGASNVPEFGDARNPADIGYILAQSPYQNVRTGVPYPAMLMTTGENDPRVSPMNSRKMTARLQAATTSGFPILLIQNAGQGHGIGSSRDQRIDDLTWTLTFFASQLHLAVLP